LRGAPVNGPLSLSGVELDGESLVRRIYCDESGTSGQGILVAASVIVHGDAQWRPVEDYIGGLINKYVAEDDRLGFVFHATELFSGSGIFKNREKYPLAHRIEAMKEILSIPSKFRLPIVFGFIRREQSPPDHSTQSYRESIATDHALAFCHCAIAAEKFMRKYAETHELAEMILEDNTETKRSVDLMLNVLRSSHPRISEYQKSVCERHQLNTDFLPITKISESVSWKGKRGARLLQVADSCAFIIRQYLEGRPDIGDFLAAFVPRGPESIADIEKVQASYGGMCEVKCWH
jgi:hypothetical protein